MFSANENLALRQHKRRIVQRVEQTMPEEALDMGTTVMVMQVSCKAPGCVPVETAIIIIFPTTSTSTTTELVPGLKESRGGGSFKTKILKPMAEVDEDDILDALPPAFVGGRRSMERLCRRARDVMLAQITQLFGEEPSEKEDRQAMALYLHQCLQDYIDRDCVPPELDQLYPETETNSGTDKGKQGKDDPKSSSSVLQDQQLSAPSTMTVSTPTTERSSVIPAKGNIVIRRPNSGDSNDFPTAISNSTNTTTTTISVRPAPPKHGRSIQQAMTTSNASRIARLFEREHAPGIRQAGCPCCDPENPSALMENMMML
ncbi:hypothetical protein IV203_028041 [Nitzschia inconspicua]|uniref:Uncharacterized protein n=1 Tax=Nitzschia inconspicua TaxID=303405 RepID=A0A9K3LXI5_9STRA|nr:hypothetical protein IV203_028041 [Nitzschia inconspicua]